MRRLRRWALGLGLGVCVLLALAAAAGLWLDREYPLDMRRYQDRSVLVLDRDGGLLRAFTTSDGMWRLPATVDDVSPLYLDMLLAYEDRRFRAHPGVDPIAVVRAVGQLIGHGQVVSGASTLTMQVARLLEPRPERSLSDKLIEMLRALQLEWHYSKDEILAIYLTLAPYGGNLEGVRAASFAYFGKEPSVLTPGEAALLVALPQSPTRLRPDRAGEAAAAARGRVLGRAVDRGVLTAEAAAEAGEQPVPLARRGMPFHAPHLADALAGAAPNVEVHPTFIDGGLQRTLEDLAARALPSFERQGNAAILVVDNAQHRVIGYLGSADFFAEDRAGQVDLARAIRSPGSTLKPFIYGMAFEELMIHPDTIINDVPTRFGDYAPTNFDPVYSGEVTVREALTRSLNIPAVAVLDRLGPARLAARLREAGGPLRLYEADALPGLAIALGGAGISLFDLVTLYTGLANGGEAEPLRLVPEDPPGRPALLLRPAANWYVTEILSSIPPPSALVDPVYARDGRRIAYKTGTSYGFRDAWAVGYDADYTVGVWVGRPDGTPSPQRYGRNTAAPLLFRVFELLPQPGRDVLPPPPPGVIDTMQQPLPPRLVRFDRSVAPQPDGGPLRLTEAALRIDFPTDGAVVELPARGTALDTLPLVALGGQRPLTWLVNGRPILSSPLGRSAEWQPDGVGQTRITVIDADGTAATVDIWLQ